MKIVKKAQNLYKYIIDMAKYHIQNTIEKSSKFDKNKNYVLMFHCIVENMMECNDEEYSITVSSFKDLIETLLCNEFKFCNVEEFTNGKRKAKILLTFDDAYRGVYSKLFVFLKKKEIPFVVFQTCDLLDKSGYLTTNMLKEMLQYDKFILGTHTISHCNLHMCEDFKREIVEPIRLFNKKFGITPEVFAYPYGAFVTIDAKNVKCAKNNYRYAFSTCNTYYRRIMCQKNCLIPRVNINENNYKIFLERVTK